MGKKRIVKKSGGGVDKGKVSRSLSRVPRKNVGAGVLYVQSTYNNTKYVDTLAYQISVRCGALNHNITIDAWNNKTYTITCDNTTKTISDSFRNTNEEQMDTWFKLNAVNSSDSRYLGNDSFIVDLSPPVIEYLNYTLQEGFRDNLTETAKYKVSDGISPQVNCDYAFNDATGTDTITDYAQEVSHAFNITPTSILSLTCRDLLNHTATTSVTYKFNIFEFLQGIDEDTANAITVYNVTMYDYNRNVTQSIKVNTTTGKTYYLTKYYSDLYYLRVYANGYYDRSYATIFEVPSLVSFKPVLLSTNSAGAILSTITVYDQYGSPIPNAYVSIMLPIGGVSYAIASGYTDASGRINVVLDSAKTYKYVVSTNTLQQYGFIYPSSAINIKLEPSAVPEALTLNTISIKLDPEPALYENLTNITVTITNHANVSISKVVVNITNGEINGKTGLVEIAGSSPSVEFAITPTGTPVRFKIWVYDTAGNVYDPDFTYIISSVANKLNKITNPDAKILLGLVAAGSVVTLSALSPLGATILMGLWGVAGYATGIFDVIDIMVGLLMAIFIYLASRYI